MPRLKGINRQKLDKAVTSQSLFNINQVVAARAINWDLIEEHLDNIVKHNAALKLGMANAVAFCNVFVGTTNNIQPITH